MTKPYTDYDHSDEEDDDDDDDDDDDIGALGSILSWDEDEEGGVGGNTAGGGSSALPDLVTFNMKDNTYLQQLSGSSGVVDVSSLNMPLPTRINFQTNSTATRSAPQDALEKLISDEQCTKEPPSTGTVQQDQLEQQHRQIQQQQQQIKQQQQQIQQQHLQQQQQQQFHHQQQIQQIQQQQQLQHQMAAPVARTQQVQDPSQPQQPQMSAQVAQQQVAQQQQQAAATLPANLQGAFTLFQQNALLAQQQAHNGKQQSLSMPVVMPTMVIPTAVQQPGQEQRTDQQPAQQQAGPQFIDPNAFLRQLQVAQLQQQFNAVQQAQAAQAQGRPMSQQVIGAGAVGGQVQAGLQQQLQFQGQVQMVAPQVPVSSTLAAQAASAAGRKKSRAAGPKLPPSTQTKNRGRAVDANGTKAPVVSASDTDGELSLQFSANGLKAPDLEMDDIDMSNMTPEEKARANRDRNREHARNTRLRKKAYLEKLKTTVDELCRERDTMVHERAGAASILVEMNHTRTEVLMSFFALRSANEKRRELWASILDECCFACVMPVTPYRSFPASEVQVSKCQRTILGIDGMMADTASLHVLLNSLVDRSRFPNATIVFRYTLVTEDAVVAGNQLMARWVMTTVNATQCGARMEVAKQGMLCVKFNSAHKIIGLELMFDVMALMLQLKQSAGSDTFSVIPNTVQTCQRSFDKPMAMILAVEPYTIVQVNKLWEDMSGYVAEEVVGKTSCRVLEGEQTNRNAVEVLMNEIRFKRPASAMVLNYKKTGERFRNFFLAYPLSTDSRITHYLIFSTHVEPVTDVGTVVNSGSVVEAHQVIGGNPSQAAASQARAVLPNYLAQNLQANFNSAQQQAAIAGALPVSQNLLSLPSVISSNPILMLPPQQQQQQFQPTALKRPLESTPGNADSSKQPKTDATAINDLATYMHPCSTPSANTNIGQIKN